MGFFARLFVPLAAVLAATALWLVVEYEQNTVFALNDLEEAPGTLTPALGPIPGAPDAKQPPAAVPAGGEKPARERFARAFDRNDSRPRIAVIISGLGLTREGTERAIDEIPAEVTLAFSPYGENLGPLVARARERGHEILLAVPMEPADVKRRDAGPAALSVNDSEAATRQRFKWMLGRIHSQVGIVGDLGDRFARDPVAMKPLFEELAAHGLLYVDNRLETPEPGMLGNGVAAASVTVWLDRDLAGDSIDREIANAETLARRDGSVVVLARPYPTTLARVSAWLKTFDRSALVAAPVSAVAKGGS